MADPERPLPLTHDLEVGDGARFAIEWRAAGADPAAPVVVLCPAMGLEASYYRPLLDALAAEGIPSLAADLRGLGGSSLRAGWSTDFGYREIVEIDLPAIVAEARRRAPGRPVVLLGHSLGGQLACLFAALHPGSVDGLLLVAACSVHFRSWPGPIGWGLAVFQGFAWGLSRVLGYFPGRTIGFAGREARGVVADWAHQGFTGRYRLRETEADPESRLRDLELPLRIVLYSDDRYVTAAAADHLLAKMPKASVERVLRTPEEAGVDAIGHFSWARRPETLLPDILDWLRDLEPRPREEASNPRRSRLRSFDRKELDMNFVFTGSRVLLGLVFFVFGLNGFLHFLPPPEPAGYLPILISSGYLTVVKVLEIVAGGLLLANRFPRLALTLLGPVIVNIVLYHLFFDLANGVPGFVTAILFAVLAWGHREGFAPLFEAKAEPA